MTAESAVQLAHSARPAILPLVLLLFLAAPSFAEQPSELVDQLEQLSFSESWREVRRRIIDVEGRMESADARMKARFELIRIRNKALAKEIEPAIVEVTTLLERSPPLDPDLELRALNLATNLLIVNDQFESGFNYFRQALERAQQVADPAMRAATYSVAAEFHYRIGELSTALEYANMALEWVGDTNGSRQKCVALERRARTRLAQQDLKPANRDFEMALDYCQSIPDLIFSGLANLGLGRIQYQRGDHLSAEARFVKALDQLGQAEFADGRLEAAIELARLQLEGDRLADASATLDSVAQVLDMPGDFSKRADAYRVMGQLAEKANDLAGAVEYERLAMIHSRERAERTRTMRLQLLMSDQDDQARHKQLELLRRQNQAIQLSQENKRQGERTILYAGSSAVIAGVLLFTLLFQTARDRRRLRRLARHDGLTALLNHTRFFELAQQNFQRAQHTGASFTLIVADVDLFKQINDSHGHLVGDEILRKIGARFREAFDDDAILGRLGGEEFGVALINCDMDQAVARIEHLRAILNTQRKRDRQPAITMSFGVAERSSERSLDLLYARADQALFDAKDAGRNRVVTIGNRNFMTS